jgi:hypothetical protein
MLPQVLREDIIFRLTSNIIRNNLDTFNSNSKKEFTDRFMRYEHNLNNKESNARRDTY